MTHLERFINNVTPLDAKHLNELVNTLNALVDNNESTQLAIRDLNEGVQNIDVLRTQLDTIENTVDEHIENCSDGEIELQVGNGYIQWRYKGDMEWNNLISITDLQVPGPPGPQGIPGNDGMNGATGSDGKSAYEIAVSNGFVGTEQEWLNSLKGDASGVATGDKIDYMGKQHKTLKETNDSNVDYLLRRVNTQKYEGSSITATNTYAKQVNNVILKGVTKFKDLDTGDFIESFEEGKNLELVGGKCNSVLIESTKLALNNKEIVDIYNNMGYDNVKANLSSDSYFVAISVGGWYYPNKVWQLKPNTTYTIQASGDGVINTTHYGNSGLKNEKWYNKYNEKYIQVVATTDNTGEFGLLLKFDINKKVDFKVFEGDSRGQLITHKLKIVQITSEILYSIDDNTYDYIDLNTGTYIKNIEVRPYQSGDESNNKVLTDQQVTLYKLEQPVVSKIDLQGQKIYSYDGVTHYTCKSESGYPSPILSMEVPTDLASLVNSQKAEIKLLKEENKDQDELINTTMMATDEMYMLIEPLLVETLSETNISKMIDMYVAMVQRQLKKIEQVPARYREQVKKIIDQSVEIIIEGDENNLDKPLSFHNE